MEKSSSRLHPLLTAAAISLTVLSAVAVASLTGLIPSSLGSSKPPAPVVEAAVPAPAAKPTQKPAPRKTTPRPKSAVQEQFIAKAADIGTVEAVKEIESKATGVPA